MQRWRYLPWPTDGRQKQTQVTQPCLVPKPVLHPYTIAINQKVHGKTTFYLGLPKGNLCSVKSIILTKALWSSYFWSSVWLLKTPRRVLEVPTSSLLTSKALDVTSQSHLFYLSYPEFSSLFICFLMVVYKRPKFFTFYIHGLYLGLRLLCQEIESISALWSLE